MIALAIAAVVAALPTADSLLQGTYSNEEQVYFAKEAGKPAPAWVSLRITGAMPTFQLQRIDAFGTDVGVPQPFAITESAGRVTIAIRNFRRDYARTAAGLAVTGQTGACNEPVAATAFTAAGMTMKTPTRTTFDQKRGRPFKCWASIPKTAKKPDGTTDWWFKPGLVLHDTGGRVGAVTDEPVPQSFTLQMHHVAWPSGPNQPSLVL